MRHTKLTPETVWLAECGICGFKWRLSMEEAAQFLPGEVRGPCWDASHASEVLIAETRREPLK